jgi:hypothetical protein
MINPGVVAAIRVVGVRGDPCGAMQCIITLTFGSPSHNIKMQILVFYEHKL